MRHRKYTHQLRQFIGFPFFTAKEAKELGVPRHALSYLVKIGDLERLYPGAYRFIDYKPLVDFQWENLALASASIPNGVICLVSALCYYELTDQIMREAWIAVPHDSYPPKRPFTKIVRMRNVELGQVNLRLGEYSIRIFDRERCIVDAFRYLSKEIALKALKRYFQDPTYKADLKKLSMYGKALRINLTPYILSYTT